MSSSTKDERHDRRPDFLALSELLTGEPSLDAALADAYQQRLARACPAALPGLIAAYRTADAAPDSAAALQAALDADAALARVARETIAVWYTAQFARPDDTQDPPESPAQYRADLVWKVIQTHPVSATPVPPSPNGYGYWTHHP
ncbi:sugar dehydrogenase complex small subunit [Streptomyces sp. NBC_00576]|uniref:sugar dehydrogenase complex small subunit n=1 Tax=Streptomyces sp. NBC_00576 TaxID=2903665 RepID=UPI003FCDDBE8